MILSYRTEPQFALIVVLNFVRNKPVAVDEFGFKSEKKAAFRAIAKQIHTQTAQHTVDRSVPLLPDSLPGAQGILRINSFWASCLIRSQMNARCQIALKTSVCCYLLNWQRAIALIR
ncbi:MAG: hypothetical protein WCC10_10905 [Tumebacillaceae bacterium]